LVRASRRGGSRNAGSTPSSMSRTTVERETPITSAACPLVSNSSLTLTSEGKSQQLRDVVSEMSCTSLTS
jgi:hypothetical protein